MDVVVCRCSFNFQSLQGLYFLSTEDKRIPTAISYYCSYMKISPNTVIPETNIIIIITAIGMTKKGDPDSLLEEENTMHVGGKEEEIKFCIQEI